MANSMKLTIITPDKEFYVGEITKLISENENGSFGILPEHVSMIISLKPTVTTFTQVDGKEMTAFTSMGILKVDGKQIELLCGACEWPEDIDLVRAEEAKKRAEMRLIEGKDIDTKRAEVALMKSLMRIKTKGM